MRALLAVFAVAIVGCGGGGGGGGYVPGGDVGCSRCSAWESCISGACQFDLGSRWNVVALSGTVSERDASGASWDVPGGAPDPYVCLTVNGATRCTVAISDSFHPSWNTPLFTQAGGGSLAGGIGFEYWDQDIAADDGICAGTVTVAIRDFDNGGFDVVCDAGLGSVSFALNYAP